jgi:hypothetical protein
LIYRLYVAHPFRQPYKRVDKHDYVDIFSIKPLVAAQKIRHSGPGKNSKKEKILEILLLI